MANCGLSECCRSQVKFYHCNKVGPSLKINRARSPFLKFDMRHGFLKPIFHQKPGSRWVPNANVIDTNNMKSTCPMRCQSESALPKLSYIPPACVGGVGASRWVNGGSRWYREDFGYEHVGFDNAKVSCWGYSPKRSPNASGIALQWNIL